MDSVTTYKRFWRLVPKLEWNIDHFTKEVETVITLDDKGAFVSLALNRAKHHKCRVCTETNMCSDCVRFTNTLYIKQLSLGNYRWHFKTILQCIMEFAQHKKCRFIYLQDYSYIPCLPVVPRFALLFLMQGRVRSIYESVFGEAKHLHTPQVLVLAQTIRAKLTCKWLYSYLCETGAPLRYSDVTLLNINQCLSDLFPKDEHVTDVKRLELIDRLEDAANYCFHCSEDDSGINISGLLMEYLYLFQCGIVFRI